MITVEKRAPSPYDAMIQGLKDQRTKLDAAILALEILRDGGIGGPAPSAPEVPATATTNGGNGNSTMFRAMSIPDAAIKLLRLRDKPMKNPEIAAELKDGGLIMNSAQPVNTVGSVLTRRSKEVGDIVKTGRGTWALREWTKYVARPKAKADNGEEVDQGDDLGADTQEAKTNVFN